MDCLVLLDSLEPYGSLFDNLLAGFSLIGSETTGSLAVGGFAEGSLNYGSLGASDGYFRESVIFCLVFL